MGAIKWHEDRRDRFLRGMRETGRADQAARAAGVTAASAYDQRARNAKFAADWDIALGEAPVGLFRERHDGWTAARRDHFLEILAKTGCVTDACRMVGMATNNAYRTRGRLAEFALAWDAALARARPALEAVAYRRAVEGVEEEIWYRGELKGTRRVTSDSLLRLLLQRHDMRVSANKSESDLADQAKEAAAAAGGLFVANPQMRREELTAAIMARLARLERADGIRTAAQKEWLDEEEDDEEGDEAEVYSGEEQSAVPYRWVREPDNDPPPPGGGGSHRLTEGEDAGRASTPPSPSTSFAGPPPPGGGG